MNIAKILLLAISHTVCGMLGVMLGFYLLPILSAPTAPTAEEIAIVTEHTMFKGAFRKDLKGSDFFHWGDGEISVTESSVALKGKISPAPDLKLYFSPEFVETEEDFIRLKSGMVLAGDVKTFENFVVSIPGTIDPSKFNSIVVWCESFGEFITAASYK